jgi:acyl-coenzyme A thioesterase 9
MPPTAEEGAILHGLWLERSDNDASQHNTVSMHETRQQIVRICHPQDRNIHSSIFGGYLMRESYELAYTTASLFLKGRPFMVASDEIVFKKPVSIGSILFLTSEVTFSQGHPHQTFQVSVTADVLKDLQSGQRECTNVFHYTFSRSEQSSPLRRIMPVTYSESIKFVEGLRRRQMGIGMRRLRE